GHGARAPESSCACRPSRRRRHPGQRVSVRDRPRLAAVRHRRVPQSDVPLTPLLRSEWLLSAGLRLTSGFGVPSDRVAVEGLPAELFDHLGGALMRILRKLGVEGEPGTWAGRPGRVTAGTALAG